MHKNTDKAIDEVLKDITVLPYFIGEYESFDALPDHLEYYDKEQNKMIKEKVPQAGHWVIIKNQVFMYNNQEWIERKSIGLPPLENPSCEMCDEESTRICQKHFHEFLDAAGRDGKYFVIESLIDDKKLLEDLILFRGDEQNTEEILKFIYNYLKEKFLKED